MRFCASGPAKGGEPVSMMYRITPALHMSTGEPYLRGSTSGTSWRLDRNVERQTPLYTLDRVSNALIYIT